MTKIAAIVLAIVAIVGVAYYQHQDVTGQVRGSVQRRDVEDTERLLKQPGHTPPGHTPHSTPDPPAPAPTQMDLTNPSGSEMGVSRTEGEDFAEHGCTLNAQKKLCICHGSANHWNYICPAQISRHAWGETDANNDRRNLKLQLGDYCPGDIIEGVGKLRVVGNKCVGDTDAPTPTPTKPPTKAPTLSPTAKPTPGPTKTPTKSPTLSPTAKPTPGPTEPPTKSPTLSPTPKPTPGPTEPPTKSPTLSPTPKPSPGPTEPPTKMHSEAPTITGSDAPTPVPETPETTPAPTPGPTKAPTPEPPTYTSGDPHIHRWNNGGEYDYHGECDLVMLHNPDFNHGQGMEIHIRTKIKRWWSYIESAVVKIGDDTLEVRSGTDDRKYWVNGVQGHRYKTSRNLDFTIGGFAGRFRAKSEIVIQYKLYLPNGQNLMIRSVKDMLRVELEHPLAEDFEHSVGLMGTFHTGKLIGRNGTEFEDTNAFGQEWQVGPSDPQLFHELEGPQHPEQCKLPDISDVTAATARRLAQSVSREDAERACAKANARERKDCIFDVMATDDVDSALGYTY